MSLFILQLEEMKRELGITDSKDDAALTLWLEGLQVKFESHCERDFLRSTSVTEYFDGDVTSLLLRRYPVESIASIHIDVDQDWDDDNLLDSDDDYLLQPNRGKIFYGRGNTKWPEGRQHIRVVYTGGYVAAGQAVGAGQTAMPDDLRRAMLLQAGFEWRNRLQLGRESVSGQGATVSLAPAELLPEVKAILSLYRRFV